ncbi:MAG TPA: hypothetical protein VK809_04610 [Bacteroidia bacterium]|jgi:hypothetical protein|nr:hypothetical protein [Bacteroidia bacterium]
MRTFILLLITVFLAIGVASAQNIDPKNNPKKDQYEKSAKQAEQQSQDDMKKQTEDFTRKKKYRKIVKKGKPGNTGKAKAEPGVIYLDK